VSRTLQVTHKGRVLIERDEISYLDGLGGAEAPMVRMYGDPIGPFSVSLNGQRPPEQVRVEAGETQTLLLSHYVRSPDRQLKISFDGPSAWAVRSLVVHAVIYQNQDFAFDRSLWVVPGLFDPDIKLEW